MKLRFDRIIRLHGLRVRKTPDSSAIKNGVMLVNKQESPLVTLICPTQEGKRRKFTENAEKETKRWKGKDGTSEPGTAWILSLILILILLFLFSLLFSEQAAWIADLHTGIEELNKIIKFHEEQALKRAAERKQQAGGNYIAVQPQSKGKNSSVREFDASRNIIN